jgi:hypothetical protein
MNNPYAANGTLAAATKKFRKRCAGLITTQAVQI